MSNTRSASKSFFDSVWLPVLWVVISIAPLFFVRDFLPDNELRYISIADEIIQNGEVFAFTNNGVPYADKPPLYLWLVSIARAVAGEHCLWIISLFSTIPAIIIVLVMNRWTAEVLPQTYRGLASLMLLTAGLFTGMMVTLRMDMLMTMWIVLAFYEFYKQSIGKSKPSGRWLFPIYIFLAVFTKGPLGFVIPLVGSAVYLFTVGRLKEFFVYWNRLTWTLLLGLCAVWFICVYAEGGKEYLDNLLFHQTVDRAVDAFHHKRPFHYYFVSMWYTFLPWSLLVLGSVIVACVKRSVIKNDFEKLFLSVGVSTIVLLSFLSGKLQVYMLPAYPFFVYFAALLMSRYDGSRWLKAAVAVPAAVLSCVIAVLIVFKDIARIDNYLSWEFYAMAILISIAGIASLITLYSRRGGLKRGVMVLAYGLTIAVFVGSWGVPEINPYIGYGAVARKAVNLADKRPGSDIYTWDVKRAENMDAYIGRDVVVIDHGHTGANPEKLRDIPVGSYLVVPSKRLSDDALKNISFDEVSRIGQYSILSIADKEGGADNDRK